MEAQSQGQFWIVEHQGGEFKRVVFDEVDHAVWQEKVTRLGENPRWETVSQQRAHQLEELLHNDLDRIYSDE